MLRSIKKFLIDFFGNIRLYKGGIILFGNSNHELKGDDIRGILNVLKPGDILLNNHKHYVSSLFIKGEFSHAGVYVGNDKVIHVVGDGIKVEDILTFTRADSFAVVRCTDKSLIAPAIAEAYILLLKGIDYDYDMNKYSDEYMYCTEFTDSLFGFPVRDTVSKTFILPDDYLVTQPLFKVIHLVKH